MTATFAETMDGAFLPMQILYQGKTDRSHPKYAFPQGFDIFHTPNTNKAAKDFLRDRFRQWYAEEVEKQVQAGAEAATVNVNMGMPVMKEAGAKWLTALYDKLTKSIIVNGLKKVGLVDVVMKAREGALSKDEEEPSPSESGDDLFDSCTELDD